MDLDVLYGFATKNLNRKPFLIVAGVKMPGIGGEFWILSDFRELSFCGPCVDTPSILGNAYKMFVLTKLSHNRLAGCTNKISYKPDGWDLIPLIPPPLSLSLMPTPSPEHNLNFCHVFVHNTLRWA